MALEQFEDEDGNPVLFDPRDVRRVWGGGCQWKDKITLVSFGDTDTRTIRGPVAEMGPKIKALQLQAFARDKQP